MKKAAGILSLFTLLTIPAATWANYSLTILHFNDAESHLLNAGDPSVDPTSAPAQNVADLCNYGGAARFVTLLSHLRAEAKTDGVITISAGDNFLPCMVFDASNPKLNAANSEGANYDALFFAATKVDLAIPGNHDFDFGPDRLAAFIDAIHAGKSNAISGFATRFVSCNIDASACPPLAKDLTPSTVFYINGERIGIVGATTWQLPSISNPGCVKMISVDLDSTAKLVQAEVDHLAASGIDKIILVSHLQSVRNEQALVRKLRGVDVVIAGGGHELLASGPYGAIPGDAPARGPYPLLQDESGAAVIDLDGKNIPVVTAGSALRYVGRLVVDFDDAGNVVSVSGAPVLVTALGPDKVPNASASAPDPAVEAALTRPVYAFIKNFGCATAATSAVDIDGLRMHVRTRETNLGDLVADAVLSEGQAQARARALAMPVAAVVNGGGIRCDGVVAKGRVTNMALRNMLPFPNYVTLVGNVSPENFKALAENMVSSVGKPAGGFGQIAGWALVYDPNAPTGSRVREIALSDGTIIVADGKAVAGAPNVCFATLDFLARGGDGYPFAANDAVVTTVLESDALQQYIKEKLGGKIDASMYPDGGNKRIQTCVTPGK
jgi:5'-nucleotidase / UDP-sugar diphosphatase